MVLYLNKKRAHPRHIFLISRSRPSQKVPEIVEIDMPVGDVMALLETRGLAEAFVAGASIYCKRQDGSTVPIQVDPKMSIQGLEQKLKQLEVRLECVFVRTCHMQEVQTSLVGRTPATFPTVKREPEESNPH